MPLGSMSTPVKFFVRFAMGLLRQSTARGDPEAPSGT
jgi:hypothetical protein